MCDFLLMYRTPPVSTRSDTLVPYTTIFRSGLHGLGLYAETGGGVLGAELLHRPQHEDGALRLRQGVDGGFQQAADLALRGGGFRAAFWGHAVLRRMLWGAVRHAAAQDRKSVV